MGMALFIVGGLLVAGFAGWWVLVLSRALEGIRELRIELEGCRERGKEKDRIIKELETMHLKALLEKNDLSAALKGLREREGQLRFAVRKAVEKLDGRGFKAKTGRLEGTRAFRRLKAVTLGECAK